MRTKNVTLGLLAFAIAIGSAFANMSTSRTAWVKVRYFGSESFLCVNTGFQCNESGLLTCKINVQTISGLTTVTAKRDAGCAITLSESTSIPIGSYIPLYGLIQESE
jgi:hypothetical protein